MGKINSRNKGAAGEREFAHYLKDNFDIEARRGQQFSGSTDSPDVVTTLKTVHFEVKRVEALNLSNAMIQAERDCGNKIPVVAHRKNRKPWLITLRAEDMEKFATAMFAHREL